MAKSAQKHRGRKAPTGRTPATTKTPAAKATAKAPRVKAPKELHECECLSGTPYHVTVADFPEYDTDELRASFQEYDVLESCGQMVARRFAPGHDAKLKSTLIQAAVAGRDMEFVRGGNRIAQSALEMAKQYGWGHFIQDAIDRTAKLQTARAARAEVTAQRRSEAAEVKAKRDAEKAKLAAERAEQVTAEAPAKAAKAAAAKARVENKGFHPVRVKIGRLTMDANLEAEEGDQVTVTYQVRGSTESKTVTVPRSKLVD